MTFPKHIMTTAELARMGFPSKTLDAIAKEPEQNIAFRLRPDETSFGTQKNCRSESKIIWFVTKRGGNR